LWRDTVDLPPGGDVSIARTLRHAGGVLTVRLEHDDGLAADNVRGVVVPSADRRQVRLDGRSRFVEAALASHPGFAIATPRNGLASQTDSSGAAAGIVVCDGCAAVPPGNSGVLMIPPRQAQPSDAAPLALTGRIFGDLVSLDGVSVVPIPVDRVVDGSRVVAHAAGLPVVVADDTGGRRIVEFRFDPDASAISRSPAFPLLMAAALDWLAPDARHPLAVVAGEPIQWALSTPETVATLAGPNGRAVDATVAGGMLVARLSEAGVYHVRDGGTQRAFVVTPDERESDLSSTAPATAPDENDASVRALSSDVSSAAMAAALLLLAAEWRYRHRAGGNDAPTTRHAPPA
jgi:hypothetical protein